MLGGLDTPTSGRVFIDGEETSRLSEDDLARMRSKKIGFVYQFHNLIPTLTALENVELPMIFRGTKQAERRKKATSLLESVGLGDRLDHTPSQLSGGQQQRVAVARALANNPAIILGDEPTGELDTKGGKEVLGIMKRLNEEDELTLVIVTHDHGVAKQAERIIHVLDGRIEQGREQNHTTGGEA